MKEKLRTTGIEVIGSAPWGTHLCQFYSSLEDLLTIVIPFLQTGLYNNEFCIWALPDGFQPDQAFRALEKAVPGLKRYERQLLISPYSDIYLRDGRFDLDRVIGGWNDRLDQALKAGFNGLRATGDTGWVIAEELRKDFLEYERELHRRVAGRELLVLCTYPLEKCAAGELIDLIACHNYALIMRQGRWERIESAEHKLAREVLLKANMELEEKVFERTAELIMTNQQFQREIAERMRVSGELNEKTRVLDAFFKYSITPLVILDNKFNFMMVNLAYAQACQMPISAFIGKNHFELFPHEENESIFRRVAASREPHRAVAKPFEFPDHPEWGVTYWNWSLVPIAGSSGEVEFLVFSLEDVTQRKRAEMSLEETKERFRALVETTSDWVWEVDENAVYTYVSPRVRDILGYEPEEVLGRTPFDLMPPDEAKRVASIFGPIAAERRPFALLENTNRHKGGRLIVLETSGLPVFDTSGAFRGYRGMDRDITERKRAEEALKRSEKSLANAQRIAHIGSWEWNPSTGDVRWSDETYRIFGLEKGVFSPSYAAVLGLVHDDDRDRFEGTVKGVLEGMKGFDLEFRAVMPDSSVRILQASGEAAFGMSGVPIEVSGFVQDITQRVRMMEEIRDHRERLEELVKERTAELKTANSLLELEVAERKKAEEKIRRLNAALEEKVFELEGANRELEAFSYTLAHDLGAPLRVIDGYSYILLKESFDRLDEEGKRFLNSIRASTGKMRRLIDDLLNLARLGRQEMRLQLLDMNDLAGSVFHELKAAAPDRDIVFDLRPLPPALGERTMIRQVFINLISNAIKFTRPVGEAHIEVGARETGGETVYYVKDNGVGFDMQHAGRLFGVFRRLHSEKEFEGTGAGLSIVHRIMERHGGRVWAKARVNGGATFYFVIPKEASSGEGKGLFAGTELS